MTDTSNRTRFYKKVILIGWDGADWRHLRPWIAAGKLPTLARLVEEGSHGNLRSTIRPESSVAWASFSTGVNPGQHGIYGFAGRTTSGSYAMPLTNASSVRTERFWEVLGRQQCRVGLLNVPYTYPPSPVNGFLVAGMLTPSVESEFTYPPALKGELLKKFGTYITDVSGPNNDKARLIENVRIYTEQQQAMALYLLKEKSWDFFSVVFVGPDRLQHFLWADMDQNHPWYNASSGFQGELLAHYQALDTTLSQILQAIPQDTLVFLISDHGFNGCARKFFVNHWLYEQGLLALNSTSGVWSSSMTLLNRLYKVPLLRELKQKLGWKKIRLSDLRSASFSNMVDWSRTQVYFGLDGGLRINLRGREPEGIVSPGQEYDDLRQSLRQQLIALCDPLTGRPVLSAVLFNDKIYHGPYVDLAPDLILEPQREQQNLAENYLLDGDLRATPKLVFTSSEPYSGNHALDGIFCAWGPGVRIAYLVEGAGIIDLAPTILGAMGCVVPKYIDGGILDIFTDPVVEQVSTGTFTGRKEAQYEYSQEETDLVEQRLRDLGYL